MRIATWNVNSLKARQDAVERWLARAEPDVLLIQETKLSDADAPAHADAHAGLRDGPSRRGPLERRRHREPGRPRGRGHQLRGWPGPGSPPGSTVAVSEDDFDPLRRGTHGVRRVRRRAGRVACTPRTAARWAHRSSRASCAGSSGCPAGWPRRGRPTAARPRRRLQRDTGRHGRLEPGQGAWRDARVRPGARGAGPAAGWGLVDAYRTQRPEAGRFSWWDYRAGMFHSNEGMRIDLLYVTASGRRARRLGGDRPRGTQGAADALGPRAGRHRPRRAGPAVRRRLDGCDRADRREDEAAPLTP